MLTFVPTPLGNLADITPRALEALSQAEIILCEDTRVTKHLLSLLKERYDFSTNYLECKPIHSHNEHLFLEQIEPTFFNQNVVYVSDAGMPAVSDPGALLVAYCQEHTIDYDVLPGGNAVMTAYAASGFNDKSFLFYGFLNHKGKERIQQLQEVLHCGYIGIVYEAPHRLIKLLEEIAHLAPDRRLFLAKELTKKFQSYYKGKALSLLEQLDEHTIKGEWVVIIEAEKKVHNLLSVEDILEAELPKKSAAKLIAKITGQNPKEVYQTLLD